MNEKTKLHLALIQIGNITSLLKGNQYESFLYNKLIGIQIELQRQLSLTNCSNSTTIQE